MTPFRATNLSNVDIHLKGNIHLPEDIPTVQAIGESRLKATITKPHGG
jgi:hypothetical protein